MAGEMARRDGRRKSRDDGDMQGGLAIPGLGGQGRGRNVGWETVDKSLNS